MPPSGSHWLGNLLTKNWGLKLMSLLLAVGFWFYAVSEETVEVSRSVPLKVETEKKELSIASRSTESIYVRLRAPRALLSVLSGGQVRAFHRIQGVLQAGEYSFRLTPADIEVPSDDIRVAGIFPEIVTLTIDETIVKKLSIKANFTGEPAFGYKVLEDKVGLDPNAILVEGPKARLNALDTVKTEPIELVGRTQSFRKLVHVVLAPNLKAISDTLVDVFVPIREEFAEEPFTDIPVKPLGLPEKGTVVELETEKIAFELKGPRSELNQLAQKGIFVYVDVSNLEKGSHALPATFILPETISLKGEPPLVSLKVI